MPITTYAPLDSSTYLDFQGYRSDVAPMSGGTPVTGFHVNVALVFERNAPAAELEALLSSDWGSRQQQIEALTASKTLWPTYGADKDVHKNVVDFLKTAGPGITLLDVDAPVNSQYVSSADSRTLWVQLDEKGFEALFGTKMLEGKTPTGVSTWYWDGALSLPTELSVAGGVAGLWFDTYAFSIVLPDETGVTPAPRKQGAQSIGNASTLSTEHKAQYPSAIAADYYNFPLTGDLWTTVKTGTIGLLESDLGTKVKDDDFLVLLDEYRLGAGIPDGIDGIASQVAPGGATDEGSGERSLDVGVVTAVNPRSELVLYAGSGNANYAHAEPFATYQAAIWDTVNKPQVITSSERFASSQIAPGSPFAFAVSELLIDAALAGITVFSSAGDGGSGFETANGVTNVSGARASPYSVIVGGTSLSDLKTAATDETLAATILADALAGDPETIWKLATNGLTSLPSTADPSRRLIETVWNTYLLAGDKFEKGYLQNLSGNGGVDTTQNVPAYQSAFGLTPTTTDGAALTGRGVPDVSANAGGNMFYLVPKKDMKDTHGDAGTSAATPFWAALASQINAIFDNQGLITTLGYMTDLLYIAGAIAPGSFNDIRHGDNTSSFLTNGIYETPDKNGANVHITPTGFGYEALPGYDLASGLGSPNGTLLARALSAIGHAQTFHSGLPDLLQSDGGGGWQSGTGQTLLLQAMSAGALDIDVTVGTADVAFDTSGGRAFAWTMRFAQQVLQRDFDPALVTMFDRQKLGTVADAFAADGAAVGVTLNGATAATPQGTLSSPYGFADFTADDGVLRIARPVAVAETAAASGDQSAVVRVRQNGQDATTLSFYAVDDYAGAVDGLQPGDPGYAAAALSNAYALQSGGTVFTGPGYGNYAETLLLGVDAGDLIAMSLVNITTGHTYWAFSQANEKVAGTPVGHLWNFGLNVWGWEDRHGGGDLDYNDLVVQLDFTSASGSGWLI